MRDKRKVTKEKLNVYLYDRDAFGDLFWAGSPSGATKKCVSSLA